MKLVKDRKTLIVGYGQDGIVLKEQILKNNKKIYVITRTILKKKEKNVSFKKLDIKNKKEVFKYLKKFNNLNIYFFATHNISSTGKENSEVFIKNLETNVIALVNFLEFITKNKKKKFRFFYASSSHIFEKSPILKQNENTTPSFVSYYALTKFLGLEICQYYREVKKIFCSVGILYTHASKHIKKNFLIKELSTKINKSKNRVVYVKNINSKIDIMTSDDAVLAMRKIINLKKPDTFIISSGKLLTIKKIFNEIVKYKKIKKKLKIKSLNTKKYNTTPLFGDNSKLRKTTSWSVSSNLKDTIKKVLN